MPDFCEAILDSGAIGVGEPVKIYGYGKSDPMGPSLPTYGEGRVLAASDSDVYYDIATVPGDSGSPIVRDIEGMAEMRVVAIHNKLIFGRERRGIRITGEVYKWVVDYIAIKVR